MLRDKKASCNYKSCMQFKQTDLGKVPQIHSLAYSHQFLHAQCPLWRQFCFQWSFNFTASRKCNAKKKTFNTWNLSKYHTKNTVYLCIPPVSKEEQRKMQYGNMKFQYKTVILKVALLGNPNHSSAELTAPDEVTRSSNKSRNQLSLFGSPKQHWSHPQQISSWLILTQREGEIHTQVSTANVPVQSLGK